ncbi:MAG: low specificity L-threonine aldolase [Rhodobacterales bacterium]|nr:MAG: low specificity L-threonine aldolase [Rhodobacterales bacterium]
MFFASDNTGPVHPQVLAALEQANQGYAMPYGGDGLMARLQDQIRDVFEAPQAVVYLVSTGTAANSLALATLADPWQTIFCTDVAHIHEDECNAPEFFTGGAKLTPIPSHNGKLRPEDLHRSIEAEETRGVHGPQRGPLSITQVTERGSVYDLAEIKALCEVAHSYNLPCHMDGARFANALVTLGCSPAEMTWQAGIDALSFGATKNGCMAAEAVIFFDPKHAWEFELRRKRGGHLPSKNRFMAAQMLAYLQDDLWLNSARAANAATARLARGLRRVDGCQFLFEPQANIIFAGFSRAAHKRLHQAGAQYYLWQGQLDGADDTEILTARMVTDWSAQDQDIDRFLELAHG